MQNDEKTLSNKKLNQFNIHSSEVKSCHSQPSPLVKKKADFTFRVISKENSGNKLNETKEGKEKIPNAEFDISRKNTDDKTYDCNFNESQYLKKKRELESDYQNGRWTKAEHIKFVEAILKHGNDWKEVQQYVNTRSSTQARSHSQKFFLKIKRCDLFNMEENVCNIQSLSSHLDKLKPEEYNKTLKILYEIPFEKGKISSKDFDSEEGSEKDNLNRCVEQPLPELKQIFLSRKEKNPSKLLMRKLNSNKASDLFEENADLPIIKKPKKQKNQVNFGFYNVGMNVNIFNFGNMKEDFPLNKVNPFNPQSLDYIKANPCVNQKFNIEQNDKDSIPMNFSNPIDNNLYQFRNKNSQYSSKNNTFNFPNLLLQETFERCINFKNSETDFEKIFLTTFNSSNANAEKHLYTEENYYDKLCSIPKLYDEESRYAESINSNNLFH